MAGRCVFPSQGYLYLYPFFLLTEFLPLAFPSPRHFPFWPRLLDQSPTPYAIPSRNPLLKDNILLSCSWRNGALIFFEFDPVQVDFPRNTRSKDSTSDPPLYRAHLLLDDVPPLPYTRMSF